MLVNAPIYTRFLNLYAKITVKPKIVPFWHIMRLQCSILHAYVCQSPGMLFLSLRLLLSLSNEAAPILLIYGSYATRLGVVVSHCKLEIARRVFSGPEITLRLFFQIS